MARGGPGTAINNRPGQLLPRLLTDTRALYGLGKGGIKVLSAEGVGSLCFKLRYHLNKNKGYGAWIKKNEPTPAELEQYKEESVRFPYRPRISIVTPVYNPDPSWIKAAIGSVLGQAYGNWELCLADASTDDAARAAVAEFKDRDPRIKVKFLPENMGIAANSGEALSMATGEYVGLMDHDDELSPDALYEVARRLQPEPEADMLYSDEDKIDIYGRRFDPFFKPGWSPDMFLSCMYTCHLSVFRKSIVDAIGGFRPGYDGSQDYDLALRFIEKAKSIVHIPRVLYHWRMTPGSTSISVLSKKYAYAAAKNALSDHMARNGIKGEVLDGTWVGSYYVRRDLIKAPKVSVIIPTRDHAEALKKCLDGILAKTTYPDYEVLVVDNGSRERRTRDYLREMESAGKIRVISYDRAFNFSAINNYAVKHAKGEMLLFLNNDTEVISGEWMSAMLEHAQRKEVGAVGCKLLYPNDTVQHAGIIIGVGNGESGDKVASHSPQLSPRGHYGYEGRECITLNLSAVTAACMMVSKDVFEDAGGFDEGLAIAYNDVDLCLRLRQKGYLIVYTPHAVLYHHESLSRGYENTREKMERFRKEVRLMRERWGSLIDAGDPYYNPNLTLDAGDFSIKS